MTTKIRALQWKYLSTMKIWISVIFQKFDCFPCKCQTFGNKRKMRINLKEIRNAWGYGILSTFTLLRTYTKVIYWSKEYFFAEKNQDTQRIFLCLSTDLYIQPFCWNLHIIYELYWIKNSPIIQTDSTLVLHKSTCLLIFNQTACNIIECKKNQQKIYNSLQLLYRGYMALLPLVYPQRDLRISVFYN